MLKSDIFRSFFLSFRSFIRRIKFLFIPFSRSNSSPFFLLCIRHFNVQSNCTSYLQCCRLYYFFSSTLSYLCCFWLRGIIKIQFKQWSECECEWLKWISLVRFLGDFHSAEYFKGHSLVNRLSPPQNKCVFCSLHLILYNWITHLKQLWFGHYEKRFIDHFRATFDAINSNFTDE